MYVIMPVSSSPSPNDQALLPEFVSVLGMLCNAVRDGTGRKVQFRVFVRSTYIVCFETGHTL